MRRELPVARAGAGGRLSIARAATPKTGGCQSTVGVLTARSRAGVRGGVRLGHREPNVHRTQDSHNGAGTRCGCRCSLREARRTVVAPRPGRRERNSPRPVPLGGWDGTKFSPVGTGYRGSSAATTTVAQQSVVRRRPTRVRPPRTRSRPAPVSRARFSAAPVSGRITAAGRFLRVTWSARTRSSSTDPPVW